jgi:hypothetical protein
MYVQSAYACNDTDLTNDAAKYLIFYRIGEIPDS